VVPQRAKVISNYAGPRLAYLEAQKAGFDDVVLTTRHRLLSEAPTANLFLVHGTTLSTPRVCDGILPGITREFVMRIAREIGIEVRECALRRDDAYGASEAFLCGTGLEFARISRFDDRALGERAPILARIVDRYFDVVRAEEPAPAESTWSSSIAHAG
jgi:branched-chain amino acid aminotransferase